MLSSRTGRAESQRNDSDVILCVENAWSFWSCKYCDNMQKRQEPGINPYCFDCEAEASKREPSGGNAEIIYFIILIILIWQKCKQYA